MEATIQTSSYFWVIILGYFTLVLGFGSFFARYNKTTQDFFFSGRRFSWWLVTMSIVATGVGSHSFLKYSAKAYEHGFFAIECWQWTNIPFSIETGDRLRRS